MNSCLTKFEIISGRVKLFEIISGRVKLFEVISGRVKLFVHCIKVKLSVPHNVCVSFISCFNYNVISFLEVDQGSSFITCEVRFFGRYIIGECKKKKLQNFKSEVWQIIVTCNKAPKVVKFLGGEGVWRPFRYIF